MQHHSSIAKKFFFFQGLTATWGQPSDVDRGVAKQHARRECAPCGDLHGGHGQETWEARYFADFDFRQVSLKVQMSHMRKIWKILLVLGRAASFSHAAVIVIVIVADGPPSPENLLEHGWSRGLHSDKRPCSGNMWSLKCTLVLSVAYSVCAGGGSALLPSPVPPITLQEIAQATKVLQSHGATIQQLNLVRKHMEILKGGGLAKLALPAKVTADCWFRVRDKKWSGVNVPSCG